MIERPADKQTTPKKSAIPLRSAFAVFLVLAVAFWLAFGTARGNIEEMFERELRAAVATLAPTISGELHDLIDEVSYQLDPEEFELIRQKLETAAEGLSLKGEESSFYTLRRAPDYDRSGDLTFVVMNKVDPETNQYFVGNRYKAQPFQLAALDGELSSSGLYSDEEGTWISAAAPITRLDGMVVGIVQADHQVVTYAARLRESLMPIIAVSLLTVLTFSFFVYRSAGLVRLAEKRRHDAQQALDELEEAKDKLVESEKLASLGQLVGGLAHELNTPIGIVVTANSMIVERLRALDEAIQSQTLKKSTLVDSLSKLIETTELSGSNLERAALLINRFKAISATQELVKPCVFEVGELLRQVKQEFQNDPIWQEYDLEWAVECADPIEVKQRLQGLSSVIHEVIKNALNHGLREKKAGQIVLRASRHQENVKVEIQDLGAGIAAEHLGQVLDPFFTTSRGRGSVGLGLTESFNIVSYQLSGEFSIDGSEGAGTIVTIEIPSSIS